MTILPTILNVVGLILACGGLVWAGWRLKRLWVHTPAEPLIPTVIALATTVADPWELDGGYALCRVHPLWQYTGRGKRRRWPKCWPYRGCPHPYRWSDWSPPAFPPAQRTWYCFGLRSRS